MYTIYICIYTYTYIHIYIHMYIDIWSACVGCIFFHTNTGGRETERTRTHTHECTHTLAHTRTHTHTHAHTYAHTRTHTHTHTHTHKHTHAYLPQRRTNRNFDGIGANGISTYKKERRHSRIVCMHPRFYAFKNQCIHELYVCIQELHAIVWMHSWISSTCVCVFVSACVWFYQILGEIWILRGNA